MGLSELVQDFFSLPIRSGDFQGICQEDAAVFVGR